MAAGGLPVTITYRRPIRAIGPAYAISTLLRFRPVRATCSDGSLVSDNTFTETHIREIISLAASNRLPSVYPFRYWAELGGLLSYGVEQTDNFRRAAAGGYPKIMNGEGIAAMIGDFLAAFPDLLITFDQFIAKDDFVVERYTASGTHLGPLGDLQPTNRTATWTGINIFRIGCGRIVEVWSEVDAEGRTRQLTLPLTSPGR